MKICWIFWIFPNNDLRMRLLMLDMLLMLHISNAFHKLFFGLVIFDYKKNVHLRLSENM